jgi:hypothetical protein
MIARYLWATVRAHALDVLADAGSRAVVAVLAPVRTAELERQNRLLKLQLQQALLDLERQKATNVRMHEVMETQAIAWAWRQSFNRAGCGT